MGLRVGLGVALAVALAVAARIWLVPAPDPPRDAPDPSARSDELAAAAGLEESPEVRTHRAQQAFSDQVRDFFEDGGELSPDDRRRRAEALRDEVRRRELSGRLLPSESLVIQLALLRESLDDPAVLDHEIDSLLEEYEERAEEARARAEARPPDPRFERYKELESEVTQEVMALDEIPGGLSRSEYLRNRLREIRVDAYGDP